MRRGEVVLGQWVHSDLTGREAPPSDGRPGGLPELSDRQYGPHPGYENYPPERDGGFA